MDSRRWRRANVLAVDDQLSNLVTLDAVLSSDYHVIRAGSGHEALSILQSRDDIDVILMDVQMPGMDGFEAASKVKQLPGCRDIPIVFITAVYNEDPFIKQGYRAGAVDYFSKPFDPEILRIKVGIYASFRQKSDLLKEWERQIQASEELLRTGRQFSAILEHPPMQVVVMDAAGRIRYANLGPIDPCPDWWDADGSLREGRSTAIAHVIAKGEMARETVEARGVDGATRSLLCTALALRERDGAPAGIVLIVRDVTERNRLESDFEQQIGRLASVSTEAGSG